MEDRIITSKSLLVDIFSEMNNRKELSNILIGEINNDIFDLKAKLFELDSWFIGRNRMIDTRRNKLEQSINELEKEKRDKETEKWQDIARLKKEFRDRFKEYKDILRRFSIISNGASR